MRVVAQLVIGMTLVAGTAIAQDKSLIDRGVQRTLSDPSPIRISG
jgi:hypothetical protein